MYVPSPGTHEVSQGTQAPLPGAAAALIGVAALVVVLVPFLWPFAEHFNAIAHEGAHALVGGAMGFSLAGVRLYRDASGVTEWGPATPDTGMRRILTRFVGYLGPSGFGLCTAKLIETGRGVTVLWIVILLLALLFVMIRKSFGIVTVSATIALLALATRYAHTGLEEILSYGLTWLLLLSGVRVALAHGANAGDAANLSRTTHIPRLLWALLWLAGTLLAVVIGGKWLVLRT
jgi:peptidase M50B-like protein